MPTPLIVEPKFGFKFGCDPELFVKDPSGKYVGAEGLIPGTKAEPFKVELGAVQVDGFAAEFNIDPVTDFEGWNNNITHVLKQLKAFLPEGYTLDAIPSVIFTEDVVENASADAKILGCTPDFNAWDGTMNPPPNTETNPLLRTASGHIHLGWVEGADIGDSQHIMNCRDMVKQLDWYLGAWSLKADADPVRRRLYGRAGACRFKDYGVEYRVLSNFWIMSKDRRLAVWNRMQQAINDMAMLCVSDRASHANCQRLVQSINDSVQDKDLQNYFRYPINTLDYSQCRL